MVQVCTQLATLSSFSLKCLENRFNQQSEWTKVHGQSPYGYFAELYRADVLLSRGEAVTFDLIEDSKLKQLKYGDISAI